MSRKHQHWLLWIFPFCIDALTRFSFILYNPQLFCGITIANYLILETGQPLAKAMASLLPGTVPCPKFVRMGSANCHVMILHQWSAMAKPLSRSVCCLKSFHPARSAPNFETSAGNCCNLLKVF